MPQFCLLFYAILQSWRPKGGGGHGTMPRPWSCRDNFTKPRHRYLLSVSQFYFISNTNTLDLHSIQILLQYRIAISQLTSRITVIKAHLQNQITTAE